MYSHVKSAKPTSSSQVKKRKTRWSAPTQTPILSLPDDLLVSCLARVSRSYYPTLSLVSKSFRSLLASPELYKARSLLGCTENCLYLCLPFPYGLNPLWFTLCRKPDKNLTQENKLGKKSSGNIFVPISRPKCFSQSCNLIPVGPKIYGIGREGWLSSSRVSVLDCRFHTWHKAPSMREKRSCFSTASLVDGKIYVAGGNSSEWAEVFDLKTQTWSSVTNPGIEFQERNGARRAKSFGLDGKFHLLITDDYYGVVYNPKEGKWNPVVGGWNDINIGHVMTGCYCVIDNVLFHWYLGDFEWYDYKVCEWKEVQGVFKDLSKFSQHWFGKTVGYGGKLVALWEENFHPHEHKIWCAEIALERRNGQNGEDIWGKVEWLDVVLTVPGSCELLKGSALISVTI